MTPKKRAVIVTTYNWKEALELVLVNLLKQSVLPSEIVIADDGSRQDTKELIEEFSKTTNIPIKHVWQEDKGFRLSKIRNKAIVACESEYIIQIDGDCVPHKHFIKDHLELVKPKTYVCGSRVNCSASYSKKWFEKKMPKPLGFFPIKGTFFNWFRIGYLRRNVMTNFRVTVKGSNMAFWKKDVIAVNGYDEDYEGWGWEDHDFVEKLKNIGVNQTTLKMGGVQYHLYHKESQRPSEQENNKRLQKIAYLRENKISKTINGLDKYLN